jgi:hypothetical protein
MVAWLMDMKVREGGKAVPLTDTDIEDGCRA